MIGLSGLVQDHGGRGREEEDNLEQTKRRKPRVSVGSWPKRRLNLPFLRHPLSLPTTTTLATKNHRLLIHHLMQHCIAMAGARDAAPSAHANGTDAGTHHCVRHWATNTQTALPSHPSTRPFVPGIVKLQRAPPRESGRCLRFGIPPSPLSNQPNRKYTAQGSVVTSHLSRPVPAQNLMPRLFLYSSYPSNIASRPACYLSLLPFDGEYLIR